MRVLRFIGWVLLELGRGLLLIVRDIHQSLYRRVGPRLWWIYLGIALILILWRTEALWSLISSLLVLAIVLGGLWLIVTAPFRGRKR